MQANELRFLQKLIHDQDTTMAEPLRIKRRWSAVAESVSMHYQIGLAVRKSFEYRDDDLKRARALLAAHQLPLKAAPHLPDRAMASLIPAWSEKHASIAPHDGEVAVLPLSSGCTFQGKELPSVLPGYLVITTDDSAALRANHLLMVENFESFVQLRRYTWLYRYAVVNQGCLAVFRGDNLFKANHALQFLRDRHEPVWAFPDVDPAGLGWTLSLPRFAGLLFPWDDLNAKLLQHNRSDLYHNSVAQWEKQLAHATHPDIQRAWQLMHRLWRGLNQEALRDS